MKEILKQTNKQTKKV